MGREGSTGLVNLVGAGGALLRVALQWHLKSYCRARGGRERLCLPVYGEFAGLSYHHCILIQCADQYSGY